MTELAIAEHHRVATEEEKQVNRKGRKREIEYPRSTSVKELLPRSFAGKVSIKDWVEALRF